ncbi:hypothetical protein TNCV_1280681 [Trichonephila clavipes]|nr:hypothetical protein TNCV_1280681 [Trichonephila clavipes]
MIKISEKLNDLLSFFALDASCHTTWHKAPWWSPAVFLAKFAPIFRSSDQHSMADAVAFLSYPKHTRLERNLAIWLAKEVFDKL